MNWTEDERRIYRPPPGTPVSDLGFDPLRVERTLRLECGGVAAFNRAQLARTAYAELAAREGVPEDELTAAELAALKAEEMVVKAAKAAFAAKDRVLTDAESLDVVDHFVGWLEGKGSPAATKPTSRPCTGCREAASVTSPTSP